MMNLSRIAAPRTGLYRDDRRRFDKWAASAGFR
jgi:hypothetical protein